MTVRAWLVVSSAILAAACGGSTAPAPAPAASTAPAADLVIVNGKVHTMDDANTIAEKPPR